MSGVTWSVNEERLLTVMYADMRSFAEMARALARSSGIKRTPIAIQRKCTKLGLHRRSVSVKTMSVKQASAYYGPKVAHFYEWIHLGILDHIVVTVRGRQTKVYKLTPEAIMAFFHNPNHWYRWQLDTIKPVALQAELSQLRNQHPWRWLSMREAAGLEHITLKAMERRVRSGHYQSAIRATSTTHTNGHWFIKSTDLGKR